MTRPISGSRNVTWWMMNSICASSAIAIGSTMVQNAALASSVLREWTRRGRASRTSGRPMPATFACGQPMKTTTTGSTSTTITIVAASMAERKPMLPVSDSSSRNEDDAAAGRAVEGEAEREPAAPFEPGVQHGRDHHRAHAGPADRHQRIGEIELPGRLHQCQQHGRRAERRQPAQDQRPQPDAGEQIVGEDDEHGGQEKREGAGRGHQRARPAMGALELGEIDALAIEAEAEHEEGHQETGQHDAPAAVMQRGFVNARCGNHQSSNRPNGTARAIVPYNPRFFK